jgi:putative endonuclease
VKPRHPASPERLRARRRGVLAETLCIWHLRLRFWRILARDYRVPVGEIDIIARRGDILAAIEVKARPSLAEAGEAVGKRQRRRVARALEHYLAGHPRLARLQPRFDVMLVVPRRLPRHIAGAWRVGED